MGYGLGRALCAGVLTCGLVIQWGPSRGQAEVGTNVDRGYMSGTASDSLGMGAHHASGTGTAAIGTGAGLHPSDVAASFGSLSPAQQSRVLQRCHAVFKEPNQAEPNQLALCRTLTGMAKQ